MAVGAAQDKTEAIEARKQVPPQFLPRSDVSLTAKFSMENVDANGDGFLNEQELRSLAIHLVKLETEEELRAALSGVLSGRMLEGFFKHRNEALQKAAKEERKARDDMYYLALLQAQIDQLKLDIEGLTNDINDIESRYFTSDEKAALDALPKDQQFAAKDATLRQKVADGDMSEAEYQRWKMLNEQRASKQQQLEQSQATLQQEIAKREARGESIKPDNIHDELVGHREENVKYTMGIAETDKAILKLEVSAAFQQMNNTELIDASIAEMNQFSRDKLLEDETISAEVKERIKVFNELGQLKEILSDIEKDLKGTPEFIVEAKNVLADAPDYVREALLRDTDISPELAAVVYDSHAEAIDPTEVKIPSEPHKVQTQATVEMPIPRLG